MFKGFSALAAGGLLLGLLGGAPAAIAAQQGNTGPAQGVTSGQAVGTNVKPSTAVEKNAGSKGAAAVGAPGVAGQPGNKNGPPPKHHAKTHHRGHKHTASTAR